MWKYFGKGKFILCLIILPLVILLPGVAQYPFPQSSQYSDMAISHFPNAFYLHKALTQWHAIPLWSPSILSGYPFAANPLSGLWYFPNWLAMIIPLPAGLNLLIMAHLIWGGIGLYRLLKSEGLTELAALFGGLAFELMPKLMAHYGAGHISLIMAVCWTPWLIVSVHGISANKANHSGGRVQKIRDYVIPAIILSSMIMADIRWIGFAGLLWISYMVMEWVNRKSRNKQQENEFTEEPICNIRVLVARIAVPIVAALGLTAPFLLPFFEYVQLSTRAELTPADSSVFSLPPSRLLGLIFPPYGDYYEWIVYPGIIVSILVGVNWAIKTQSKYKVYWSVVFFATSIFALGSYLPGSAWLASIPGISLLRVPSRILFISVMALICLAARGLDLLLLAKGEKDYKVVKLILVGVVSFLFILNIGAALITSRLVENIFWGLIFGSIGIFALWMIIHKKTPVIWFIVIVGVSVLDWIAVDRSLFSHRTEQDVFAAGKEIVNYLSKDTDMYRVYSPSYSLPQQVAAVHGIELADGIDPLQLERYVRFMEKAGGVEQDEYSVTFPPYKTGNPAEDNKNARPNPELLGLLNVKYVIAEFDIDVQGLELLAQFDQSRLYLNRYWLPRAWVQPIDDPIGKNVTQVREISWSPNRVRVTLAQSDEAQYLVLSELNYPGWQVYVDGQVRQLLSVQDLLRGVEILPGGSLVEFVFRPVSLLWGIFIFMITILFVAGLLTYHGCHSRQ